MGEVPVVREAIDAKIDRSVFGLVGDLFLDQEIDHLNHLSDILRVSGRRIKISVFDPQRPHILKKRRSELFGKLGQRYVGGATIPDRLIIHVGDVHHAIDGEPSGFEMPLQQVFKEIGAEVADMGKRINGRSASIHLYQFSCRIDRFERFYRSRKGIEKPDHGSDLKFTTEYSK